MGGGGEERRREGRRGIVFCEAPLDFLRFSLMSLLIYFVIKLMKSKGKYRNTDSELFSLQTQIRAELNILRKTYEDVKTSGQRKI